MRAGRPQASDDGAEGMFAGSDTAGEIAVSNTPKSDGLDPLVRKVTAVAPSAKRMIRRIAALKLLLKPRE